MAHNIERRNGLQTVDGLAVPTSLTVHVPGQRVCVTARALGIPWEAHFSHWEKNSNRRYPDRRVYDGIDTTEEGAKILYAHWAQEEQKAEARRYRKWLEAHQPKEVIEAQLLKKAEAEARRLKRELDKIRAEVNRRWSLDPDDVDGFARHAKEPGEGRVLRTRTACTESFEQKVFMALVAWVRHQKTDYETELESAKDRAYAEYRDMRPDFDAGERWSDGIYDREEVEWALDDARAAAKEARDRLHLKFTNEATAWLKVRERAVV